MWSHILALTCPQKPSRTEEIPGLGSGFPYCQVIQETLEVPGVVFRTPLELGSIPTCLLGQRAGDCPWPKVHGGYWAV